MADTADSDESPDDDPLEALRNTDMEEPSDDLTADEAFDDLPADDGDDTVEVWDPEERIAEADGEPAADEANDSDSIASEAPTEDGDGEDDDRLLVTIRRGRTRRVSALRTPRTVVTHRPPDTCAGPDTPWSGTLVGRSLGYGYGVVAGRTTSATRLTADGSVDVEADATVETALDALHATRPALAEEVLDENEELADHIRVLVDGETRSPPAKGWRRPSSGRTGAVPAGQRRLDGSRPDRSTGRATVTFEMTTRTPS